MPPSEWKWIRDRNGNIRLEGTNLVFRDADPAVGPRFDIHGGLAKLLSAVPLLLAACHELIEAVEDPDFEQQPYCVINGQAAIAMATSEQSPTDLATREAISQVMETFVALMKYEWPGLLER